MASGWWMHIPETERYLEPAEDASGSLRHQRGALFRNYTKAYLHECDLEKRYSMHAEQTPLNSRVSGCCPVHYSIRAIYLVLFCAMS